MDTIKQQLYNNRDETTLDASQDHTGTQERFQASRDAELPGQDRSTGLMAYKDSLDTWLGDGMAAQLISLAAELAREFKEVFLKTDYNKRVTILNSVLCIAIWLVTSL